MMHEKILSSELMNFKLNKILQSQLIKKKKKKIN